MKLRHDEIRKGEEERNEERRKNKKNVFRRIGEKFREYFKTTVAVLITGVVITATTLTANSCGNDQQEPPVYYITAPQDATANEVGGDAYKDAGDVGKDTASDALEDATENDGSEDVSDVGKPKQCTIIDTQRMVSVATGEMFIINIEENDYSINIPIKVKNIVSPDGGEGYVNIGVCDKNEAIEACDEEQKTGALIKENEEKEVKIYAEKSDGGMDEITLKLTLCGIEKEEEDKATFVSNAGSLKKIGKLSDAGVDTSGDVAPDVVDAGKDVLDAGLDAIEEVGGDTEDVGAEVEEDVVSSDAAEDVADEELDGGVVDAGEDVLDQDVVSDVVSDGESTDVCEVQESCEEPQNSSGTLFSISQEDGGQEEIGYTESIEECTVTNQDCSTSQLVNKLEFKFSRPLTPAEQGLFAKQHVEMDKLGDVVKLTSQQLIFGTELAYRDEFKKGESLKNGAAEVTCLTINESNGVYTVWVSYTNNSSLLYQPTKIIDLTKLSNSSIYLKMDNGELLETKKEISGDYTVRFKPKNSNNIMHLDIYNGEVIHINGNNDVYTLQVRYKSGSSSRLYQARSGSDPVQLGSDNVYLKVYSGKTVNGEQSVAASLLKDVKTVGNGETVELELKEGQKTNYELTINVNIGEDVGQPNDVTGITFTRK